jgi:hypothetical protein
MNSYETIRKIYVDKLGIPENVVDLIAVQDVLKFCAIGISNEEISSLLQIDEDAVEDILKAYYSFNGWIEDLDLNVYSVYLRNTSFQGYSEDVKLVSGTISDKAIKDSYEICYKYNEIRKEIERYDGN